MEPAKKQNKNTPKPKLSLWNQIATGIFIFFLIIAGFTFLFQDKADKKDILISDIATRITDEPETIKSLTVQGDKIELTTTDDEVFKTKKEHEIALSEALLNYGVSAKQLSTIPLEVKKESQFEYILFHVVPVVLPILFILIFIWLISS